MFYTKGIDITNDKQMFNFLKNHFEYWTMNSWNRQKSVANYVKLYRLDLSGDWTVALSMLEGGEYDTINWMIQDWKEEHQGYDVYFNGRSGGYLVLKPFNYNGSIFSDAILENETYEEYKEWCRDNYGSVKANRAQLRGLTKLVQDFDKLCDEIRDFCDELSNFHYETYEMERTVEAFNEDYYDDLEHLGFNELSCDSEGRVYVGEIMTLKSLYETFKRLADRSSAGYKLVFDRHSTMVQLKSIYK